MQAQKEQEAYLQLSDQAFQIREQAIQTKNKFQAQLEDLLSDMEARMGQINLEDESDRIEQMYQLARINNDKYLNKLQLEGARTRLDNDAKFQEEMMRSLFAENTSLLRNNFSFKMALLADQKEFEKEIAQMDIDTAIRLLEGELGAAKEAGMYTGLASAVSGVTKYVSESSKKETDSPAPQPRVVNSSNLYQEPETGYLTSGTQFGKAQV
jgi:hypothetical protein